MKLTDFIKRSKSTEFPVGRHAVIRELEQYISRKWRHDPEFEIDEEGRVTAGLPLVIHSKKRLPVRFKTTGTLEIIGSDLETLEGAPTRVDGNFICYGHLRLTSLKFAPETVAWRADFSNGSISSMVGCPMTATELNLSWNNLSEVDACPESATLIDLGHNKIESLKGVHKVLTGDVKTLMLNSNPLKSHLLGLCLTKLQHVIYVPTVGTKHVGQAVDIINKHLGKGKAGVIGAQQELLDAGLDDYAQL